MNPYKWLGARSEDTPRRWRVEAFRNVIWGWRVKEFMGVWKAVPWEQEREEFLRPARRPATAWGYGSGDRGAWSHFPIPGREPRGPGWGRRPSQASCSAWDKRGF